MGLTTETYDIITRIAIGNGALVYRAVDKSSLRQVALKLLSQEGELDHRMNLDELFAAAPQLTQIGGAHICQLLNAHSDDDGPVLVYEFANGISGAEFPHQRKLDATQALDVAAQLISSLRSGERQRTPHGDLKPSQIIFVDMPDGRPFTFVLDWGLALFRANLPEDSMPYLAPERLGGGPPSHSADLFSAGAVLFYLFTGKRLAGGDDAAAIAEAWKRVQPGVLAELRPDLSPKLVQWVCSLLSLDPAQRPASAVEAGTTLAALGPPPPQVPPEVIRPRPVQQRPASSLPPLPTQAVAKPAVSGVRPASAAPAVRAQPVRSAVPPPKKSSTLLTVGLLIVGLAGLVVGIMIMMKARNKDVAAPAAESERSSRPAAPSVARADTKKPEPVPSAIPVAANPTAQVAAAPQPAPNVAVTAPAPPPVPKVADSPKVSKVDPIFVAAETFTYGAGSPLDGLAEGTGWSDSWHGPDAKIEASSISYPGHPMAGGSLLIGEAPGEIWKRNVGPLANFVKDPKKPDNWYLTFLLQHSDDSPAESGDVIFNPFDVEKPLEFVRIVVTDTGTGLRISQSNSKDTIDVPDASKPILVISRIDLSNPLHDWWDVKVTTIVNPNLASVAFPREAKAVVTELKRQVLPKQLGLSIRKGRGEADTRIDEIRFVRHWEEMVFRPETKPPKK